MRNLRAILYLLPLLAYGCKPVIYSFSVKPLTAGAKDTLHLQWKVKGKATLLIHDLDYPGSGTGRLADLILLVSLHGNTRAYTLRGDDTLKISLPGEDSLVIYKKPDNIQDDRLRYFVLVAQKKTTESDSVRQVAIRPDSASDEIGFRTVIRGDSLVAEGINNPLRWGNSFTILTVLNRGNRLIDVTHSGITEPLRPGDQSDSAFKNTPVEGAWQFRSLLTQEEKNDHRLVPYLIKISITLKYH